MAEVQIDSLTIENFGPFYGEHEFVLSNLDGRCGILIGGKNGAGKTHLLRALYLAVVGESGMGDLKRVETGSDATKFLFDKSLNRRAQAEGKNTVKLNVCISMRNEKNAGSRKVSITREIRYRPNSSPSWKSYAERSDTPGIIDDDQVLQNIRDAFLPRHLARFFFFDAERSQSINLGQQDIVEGITRILGLWTYGELETDLRSLIQNKIPRVFSTIGGDDPVTKLIDLNADVNRIEGYLNVRRNELDARKQEFQEIETLLIEVEDDLRILGVVDPEEIQRTQERRDAIKKTKDDLERILASAWEFDLPVSLLGSYRSGLHDYLITEDRRREWEGAKSTVEPKIPQVKQDVFNESVPPEFILSPEIESYYLKRLEDALNRLFNPPPEGMPDRVFVTDRNDISAQVQSQLSIAAGSLKQLATMCIDIEHMNAELREIDSRLKQIQLDSAAYKRGTALHEQRGKYLAQHEQLIKRISEIESEIRRLETELGELKRQETNQREITEKAEKGDNLATMASRYIKAAAEIRSRAAISMRNKIGEHVGALWADVSERSREFVSMNFDSHWQCWLVKPDGKKVLWEETNTSAGQRQVRMLAFYEALRRLAKLVPPLVVDTPLARLDKEVRANVLDKLYLSGHQSIILTTNSEIDPESVLFENIHDRLARVYSLQAYGKPNSTDYEVRVKNDYFGREL